MLSETCRLLDRLAPRLPHTPAVVVDEDRARANIATMAAKAAAAGVRFRPHFKTHQNVGVGRWFRDAGVRNITVSSRVMAEQFAADGWDDITLAVLLNPRDLPRLAELAWRLADRGGALGLLVDTPEAARAVRHAVGDTALLWLKVDTGYGRTGVRWDDRAQLKAVADAAALAGLLTHAGHSYQTPAADLPGLFAETVWRLASAREASGRDLLLSTGDTPTCTAAADFTGVDEIRPGNFLFYDLMQRAQGVCGDENLAAAVVCPVLAVDRSAGRVVLHGGAVHLSKEHLARTDGAPIYGSLGTVTPQGYGGVLDEAPLVGLSQEHGIVCLETARRDVVAADLRPGDLVPVWPVHVCLACDLHAGIITLAGRHLPRHATKEPA